MATLRQYYETDFSHTTRVCVKVPVGAENLEGSILYDFAAFSAFLALYIPGADRTVDYFVNLLSNLNYGSTQLPLDGRVTLPTTKEFPGGLTIDNRDQFEIRAQYFGDPEWVSTRSIPASRRIFIYSEANLDQCKINLLKEKARALGHNLQFRADGFRAERSKRENPLAFICHDYRDKDAVARRLAERLQQMLCPVWYDEFSLKIGDRLRESIEKGLKECRKCILVLSPNFLSNKGWTKVEFDSIFTRQILEEQKLVLPIWYKVTKHEVFDYSPSLLNVKGTDWDLLGEEEICRQIYTAIVS